MVNQLSPRKWHPSLKSAALVSSCCTYCATRASGRQLSTHRNNHKRNKPCACLRTHSAIVPTPLSYPIRYCTPSAIVPRPRPHPLSYPCVTTIALPLHFNGQETGSAGVRRPAGRALRHHSVQVCSIAVSVCSAPCSECRGFSSVLATVRFAHLIYWTLWSYCNITLDSRVNVTCV